MRYTDWVELALRTLAETYEQGRSNQHLYGVLFHDWAEALVNAQGLAGIDADAVQSSLADNALLDLMQMGLIERNDLGNGYYKPTQAGRTVLGKEGGLETTWPGIRGVELSTDQEEILRKIAELSENEYLSFARTPGIPFDKLCEELGSRWDDSTYEGSIHANSITEELEEFGLVSYPRWLGGGTARPTYAGFVWSAGREWPDWHARWQLVEATKSKAGGQGTVRKVVCITDSKETRAGILGALKEMNPNNVRSTERRVRMVREVNALQRLNDPHVPKVLEHNMAAVGDKDVRLYIISEWVDGKTLSDYCSGKGQSIDEALRITLSLARTVEMCHSVNIYHRDIKPDNIIMKIGAAEPMLIDFGLAWVWSDDARLDDITGAADDLRNKFLDLPELSSSDNKEDPRSDVTYLVGVLFFLLTGRKPLQLVDTSGGHPHQVFAKKFAGKITSDSRWPSINAVFDKGFKYQLAERFQTIDELTVALQAIKP